MIFNYFQDNHVRQMASGTFATLIKLIPLDNSDNSFDKLPEQLAAKKAGTGSNHSYTFGF